MKEPCPVSSLLLIPAIFVCLSLAACSSGGTGGSGAANAASGAGSPAVSDISGAGTYLGGPDAVGSGTRTDPCFLPVSLNLADLGGNGWTDLLAAIDAAGKYVALDLSACTMTGT
ncbi:MAG: hypothetical protein LBJ24_01855, partial [Treponema sp.]|nr:hypothetical protein [Treponema sp.]